MNAKVYNISCVMRSGGDFNWNHVQFLKDQLDEHLTLNFKLYVLSDQFMPESLMKQNCQGVILRHLWHGWWSKIELFKNFSESFYFDLDTAIVSNINHIVSFPHSFSALRGFYGRAFGSGLMAWNGEYRFIYEDFKFQNPQFIMQLYKGMKKGDQEFIGEKIKNPLIFQDQFKDQILSYKIHVRGKELSKKATIICFHGKPRIQDIKEPWLNLEKKESQDSQLNLI